MEKNVKRHSIHCFNFKSNAAIWEFGKFADKARPDATGLTHNSLAAAAAKSLQSCPTLCDPIDGSPPGSSVPGILQARTLKWVAISFSNVWKWKVKVKSLSHVRPSATPWTAAYQAPPSMGFSRQEYWSGLPLPSPFIMIFKVMLYDGCLTWLFQNFILYLDMLYLGILLYLNSL